MFIWKGHGILIPVLAVGAFIGGSILGSIVFLLLKVQVPFLGLAAGMWCATFAVWLYAKTLGRTKEERFLDPRTRTYVMRTTRHDFFFISPTIWVYIGVVLSLGMSVLVPFLPKPDFSKDYAKTPGKQEFHDANGLITSKREGLAHGNSSTAKKLAEEFSTAIKIFRKLGVEESKNKNRVSLTGGEFLTYCHLDEDSCVFLVHVPELRNFADDAKEFVCTAAWHSASQVVAELPAPPKQLAVGVRGVLLYEEVLVGKVAKAGEDPEESIEDRLDGLDTEALYPFFAPEAAGDTPKGTEANGKTVAVTDKAGPEAVTGETKGKAAPESPGTPAMTAAAEAPVPAPAPAPAAVPSPAPAPTPEPAPVPAPAATLPTPVRDWRSADGRPLRASLLGFNEAGTAARVKREDGTEFEVPLDKFSTEDQAELKRLQEAAAAAPASR